MNDHYLRQGTQIALVQTVAMVAYFLSYTNTSVFNRLFNLGKFRHYITENSSVAIYKETILPVFDYAGFMVISCNKSDRHDLQTIQNDALRPYYNVKRCDQLSIYTIHGRANL